MDCSRRQGSNRRPSAHHVVLLLRFVVSRRGYGGARQQQNQCLQYSSVRHLSASAYYPRIAPRRFERAATRPECRKASRRILAAEHLLQRPVPLRPVFPHRRPRRPHLCHNQMVAEVATPSDADSAPRSMRRSRQNLPLWVLVRHLQPLAPVPVRFG